MDETLRGGKGSRGPVAGFVWKLIRESIGMTQVQFAESVGIDVATVQGWESGRRPLAAVRSGDLARLRVRLIRRGASPKLFAVLADAMEADLIIDHALIAGSDAGSPDHHPLAAVVHRRDLTNLITWPLTGVLPTQLRDLVKTGSTRRGPAPDQPVMAADARHAFFDHILRLAERHRDGEEALLRRQAVYLLSFDVRGPTKDWLRDEYACSVFRVRCSNDPTQWLAVRSAAVALTRYGDRDPLRSFIASGLRDEAQETANLNYWAYWLGEVREVHTNDTFMHTILPTTWEGSHLLCHLVNRIAPGADQLELNVRTLWQLVLARPHLLKERPELRGVMSARVEETLDCHDLEDRVRLELFDVAYAIRLARR